MDSCTDKKTNGPANAVELKSFHQDGLFDWQISSKAHQQYWEERQFNEEKYWGGFSRDAFDPAIDQLPAWAIGPFEKYQGNPVFSPSEDGWDRGHFSGGVHNGSILRLNDLFYYIYRGEHGIERETADGQDSYFDYICDIGLATSPDGIHFTRDTAHSPFFRTGEDAKYSYEDVNLVKHGSTYYLFCNRWNWKNPVDPSDCGIFLAVSSDLVHWDKKGLVFPDATQIHRNACVVQNPHNEAVKVNGKFVMYINNGLIAYSDDLLIWESQPVEETWPGGEGCFALADYSGSCKNNILLFTGGHHTGNFYTVGEVLFSKDNPGKPLEWLPRPVLQTESQYPWENGLSAQPPYHPVSCWRNTVFFTGMTLLDGEWWMYYGGSEYYTCLAKALAQI
jgi:predicted GH43/DUF377 family glycosyl hydrolase